MIHEFPKAVYLAGSGHAVVVESAEHEASVRGLPTAVFDEAAALQEIEAKHSTVDVGLDTVQPEIARRRGRPRKT